MRLGVDEVGVTELIAVTEHAEAQAKVAGALLLDEDRPEQCLLALPAPDAQDPSAARLLGEIRSALPASLTAGGLPLLWRALAANPHHLEATWRKEQVVMREGALSARDKRRVALAVAMNRTSPYMIRYTTALLRADGESDAGILEVLGVVDHFNSLNTLTDAMQVESDIRPPG
jgi:alkylhydroperoxidase/carboxymuconolactone decarboxylase family protein YurZ